MIDSKERGTIIFALEQYAEALEGEGDYQAKNSVLELIWKLDEREGECDKCANSYDLSSRDNRCGDCGNCDDCCTHKGEGK